jgi:hypothetical protein
MGQGDGALTGTHAAAAAGAAGLGEHSMNGQHSSSNEGLEPHVMCVSGNDIAAAEAARRR